MRGVMFQELKDFVLHKLGLDGWGNVVKSAGVDRTFYASIKAYPDREILALLEATARSLGLPINQLLEEFGRFIAPRAYQTRQYLFKPEWDYLDIVGNVGEILKKVIDFQYPDVATSQVVFQCVRDSQNQLTVHYSSPRQHCDLWKGCFKGLAEHLGYKVEIDEPICMHEGDDECELIVRVIGKIGEPEDTPVNSISTHKFDDV